ncbi:MAG: hypothetical protein QM724_04580 [Flavobacteriales bacterium]
MLQNTGSALRAELMGEVKDGKGGMTLAFHSAAFTLPSGVSSISASMVEMASYIYGGTEAGRMAQQFQRLPEGHYSYCFRLIGASGERQDEYCDALEVEAMLYLDLVQPWDGDTIEELRPPLHWMLSGDPASVAQADVRLVLVPDPQKKNAAQALASERPVFMVPHVQERVLAYPGGVPDLERGKCYAWQAERMKGAQVVDRSEPWSFCVRSLPVTLPNKYVHLGHTLPGSIYEVVDGRIHFRYDEAYASTRLDCIIHDERGEQVRPEVRTDVPDGAVDGRAVGVNVYELDLAPYHLGNGYYDLVVRDEKQRVYTLKFHVVH